MPTVLPLTAATMPPDGGETSMLAAALADLGVQSTVDALVQAFQPDVALGERSLVFIGGRLSHAVLKTSAAGE